MSAMSHALSETPMTELPMHLDPDRSSYLARHEYEEEPLAAAIVRVAEAVGIDVEAEGTVLNDVVDVTAAERLLEGTLTRHPDARTSTSVSFLAWGLLFVVRHEEVLVYDPDTVQNSA